MFTLIYHNGQFNRPDTLVPFLQSNVGGYPSLQVDCITPFPGTKDDLIKAVCDYLNKVDSDIEVTYNVKSYPRTETNSKGIFVNYLAMQIYVQQKYK